MKRYSTFPKAPELEPQHHRQFSVIPRTHTNPVTWGSRIHRLHLCSGVRPPSPKNECPAYDTKQFDDEVLAMLELWGMRSTPSLPSLPGQLWPGVIAPERVLFICQRKLFDIKTECNPMNSAKLRGSLNEFPDFFSYGHFY